MAKINQTTDLRLKLLQWLCLLLATGCLGSVAMAQTSIALPWHEPFDYDATGSPNLGASSASGSDTWGNANVAEIKIASGNLTYAGLAAAIGNKVAVSGGTRNAFNDPRPELASPVGSGSIYVSFLMRVRSTTGIDTSNPGNAVIGLTSASGSSRYGSVNIWSSSGTTRVGAVKWNGGTTRSSTAFFATGISANDTTTYFVVLKYQFVSGSKNDAVSVWLNPASSYFGGTTEDPANKVTSTSGTDGTSTISRIYLLRGHNVDIDEIRSGTTWASVTPTGGCTTPGVPGSPVATAQCSSVALSWTASAPAATSYNVYRSITSGSYGAALATGIATTTYTDSTAVAGTTYFYKVTGVSGTCESAVVSSTEVNASPVAAPTTANANVDQTVCSLSATLAGNTPTVGVGTWTKVSGPGTVTFTPGANTPGATATASATGVYVLRWTIANAPCTASTDDVQITCNASPTTANAGPDQSGVCNLVATLAGNTPTVGSGTWTKVSGAGTVTFSPNANTPNATATVSAADTYVFRWSIANAPCADSTDDVQVGYAALPTTANASSDQTVCGLSATLAGNTPVVGAGTWTTVSGPGTVTFSPNANTPGASATASANGVYILRWTIANGSCNSADEVQITCNASPATANAGADQNVSGLLATLAGNTPSIGSGTWTKVSGPGTVTFAPNANTAAATATVSAAGTYFLRWTIANAPCTASTDDVSVTYTVQASGISVLNNPAPAPAASGTTTAISALATVSSGADVLVVMLATRGGSTAYSDPATLSWNGQTLNRVVTQATATSTYRSVSIYYLFNPTPGTANVTGTGATGTSFWALKSFTLDGVDTAVAPLTGSASSGSSSGSTSPSFNIAGCPSGGLAAVVANWSTITTPITFSGTGGTPTTTSEFFSAASGNDIGMGYIAEVSGGTDTFTASVATANKCAFAAAVFTPSWQNTPPSITTQPQSKTVYAGSSETFTVSAIGSPVLQYQWYFNGATPIANATNASYTVNNAQLSNEGTYSVTVNNSFGSATSTAATLTINTNDQWAMMGWCTQPYRGLATTTGGAGGATVTVSNITDLNTYAMSSTAYIIYVSGNLSGSFSISSNKSIIGLNGASISNCSISMTRGPNIILRNLKLVGKNCSDCAACDGCGSDVIGAEGTNVHNLWLDHLDISDGSDGNLDFSGAADMVTVSWCKFWYSNPAKGHRLSNLFSGSDTSFSDRGHLRITYSHCWWAANVDQRMPRGRFGQIHLLNCYWNSSGNSYCVNAGVEAQVRLENGYFSGVSDPHQVDQTSGALEASGNIYVNCSGLQQVRGTVFTPPYPYTLDAASDVPTILQNGVGPGKGPFAP